VLFQNRNCISIYSIEVSVSVHAAQRCGLELIGFPELSIRAAKLDGLKTKKRGKVAFDVNSVSGLDLSLS